MDAMHLKCYQPLGRKIIYEVSALDTIYVSADIRTDSFDAIVIPLAWYKRVFSFVISSKRVEPSSSRLVIYADNRAHVHLGKRVD